MQKEFVEALIQLKEEEALRLVQEELEAGTDPLAILQTCQAGMSKVGEKFEQGSYYLSELIYSGHIFGQISSILKDKMIAQNKDRDLPSKGSVVIGTIQGDIHDLGKNIVIMLLEGAGYEVIDLGVDVPLERFVEKVEESKAKVLALSALMTTSFRPMKELLKILEEKDLRRQVRVMIGGGVVDESSCRFVGADMHSRNAYEAVLFCNKAYQ